MLIEEARRLGVENAVKITGWLGETEAWDHVRAADVCVSPYLPIPILRSTSPTKLVEYMALERPVVANTHPEQSEILHRSGAGLLCEWDETEFAAAITYLLEQPDEAAERGRAGRMFVEQYRTNEHMADLVESTYRRVLDSSFPAQPNKASIEGR